MREGLLRYAERAALGLMLAGTFLSGIFMLAPYHDTVAGLWIGILATSLLGLLLAVAVTAVNVFRALSHRLGRGGHPGGGRHPANEDSAGDPPSYAAAA